MWPSFETAVWLYDKANIFLIGALVVGAIATVLVVWMGNVKEEYLRRDLADTNARAEEAKAQAAEANEKAESERLARVKIEEKLKPRRLTPEQQSSITKHMLAWAKLPGTEIAQSIAVFATSTTFESSRLADQIAASLASAGWNINRNSVTFGMSLTVGGVGLLTSNNPRSIAVAGALAKALNEERIDAFVVPTKRSGCEEQKMSPERIATDPFCSQVSVLVGDHP